ncbi:MAG: hypothetical protein GX946_04805 [Oligosphaeraceae bacterium]|nr:hypothetical protein [Oligosphaeraceae bacterium]
MIKIEFPFHGAVLHHRYGLQTDEGLHIEVQGQAPLEAQVNVNGVEARRKGERFFAPLTLTSFRNEIQASYSSVQGSGEHRIEVVWHKQSCKRYRVSIDDNIFFLRDLYQKKPKDIFDNHYLAILKRLHQSYGSKFSCNLFYSTPEHDFDLSQMPDCWKSQFEDNSNWLKFTFHAKNEFPDRPYQFADAKEILTDLNLIKEQILRFAGENSYCIPTVVHWGQVPASLYKTLYEQGLRVLSGYFVKSELGYDVHYSMDAVRSNYLSSHDALMDMDSGMCFSRVDMVINSTPLEDIVPILTERMMDRDNAEFMDLLTHEQYFWPFYFNYVPDHEQRMAAAFQFLDEHGYEPIWMHEGLMGV